MVLCSVASGCVMSNNFNSGIVEYRLDIVPRCIIQFEDDYWVWRDKQPKSFDVEKDIRLAMIFSGNFSMSNSEIEKALCKKSFLFSSHLAKAMNFYGSHVTPNQLYFNLINRLSEDSSKELDLESFIQVFISSIEELEQRFNES